MKVEASEDFENTVILDTEVSVSSVYRVETFLDEVLANVDYVLAHHEVKTAYGTSNKVRVIINDPNCTFADAEVMCKLRSGMTLIDHINLYCRLSRETAATSMINIDGV
jgi:hypothetical protein